jgi:adenylate cyclase
MWAGKFESADKCFDRAISILETIPKATASLSRRNIIHAYAYGFSASNTWFLGFPDRAVRKLDNAFTTARGLDSRAVNAAVHDSATLFFFLLREGQRTKTHAESLVTLATELGDLFLRAIGELYLGWFDSVACDRPEGITRMQHAVANLRAGGSVTVTSLFLSLIAQSLCLLGRYDEALVTIDEALAVVEKTGERLCEAEGHRTKGELLLAKGVSSAAQAEQLFRTAIEIARGQKAKSWELRATTSLARLLCGTNRRDEARAMLGEIYNWFTEGFDTADLKDAKALLDELNQ